MADPGLNREIRNAEAVVDATARNPHQRQKALVILTYLTAKRYGSTNSLEDLQSAILALEKAVRLTPDNFATKMIHLNSLSYFLFIRYKKLRAHEDLENTITIAQRVVNATRSEDPQLAQTLDSLASMLCAHGKPTDLENAVKNSRRAIRLTPRENGDLPSRLCNLARILGTRHRNTHRLEDLDEAIRVALEAKEITPDANPVKPEVLRVLSLQYQDRFARDKSIDDLNSASSAIQRAIALLPELPEDSQVEGPFLNCLSTVLSAGFFASKAVRPAEPTPTQKAKDLEILEASVEAARKAVHLTRKDNHDQLAYMDTLSNSLAVLFEETGSIPFMDEAIRVQKEMIQLTPSTDPRTAELLDNLGMKLEKHSQKVGNKQELDEGLTAFLSSFNCTSGRPSVRVWAARGAVRLLIEKKKWPEAWEVSSSAVRMLPLINRRSLRMADKGQLMVGFNGVAALACSLSLKISDDLLQAIDILEIGRGAVFGHEIDARSDFSDLKRKYPIKAVRFDRLRKAIICVVGSSDSGSLEQHIKDDEELECCIQEIRQLAGFERFLMTPSLKELQQLAAEGPIVIVNVSYIRSDAIIISHKSIKVLPLPSMTDEDVLKWMNDYLTNYEPEDYGPKNKAFVEFQSWLWETCVHPIISSFEARESFGRNHHGNLPRIWWIGTGLASSLPFHAAGDHSPKCLENTFSHVVSSYIPTIKALIYARERSRSSRRLGEGISPELPKLLTVSMPSTPGQNDLKSVQEEIADIETAVKQHCQVTKLLQPSIATVLEHLPLFNIVHFACHGESDIYDSLESCIILQKDGPPGYDEPIADQLKVREIARIDLKSARIAYLSACSTAESRVWDLKDEVIHISSGFLIAGYSHTIGAKWPARDDVSVKVARSFYEGLASGGEMENGTVARALHDSVDKVRSTRMYKQPLAWAPYAHIGA